MNRLCLITVLVIGGLLTPMASADGQPVNAMCPISKEPVAASAGTVDHEGQTVGFCCPACIRMFEAWDEPRRDKFVALHEEGQLAEPSGPAREIADILELPLGTVMSRLHRGRKILQRNLGSLREVSHPRTASA